MARLFLGTMLLLVATAPVMMWSMVQDTSSQMEQHVREEDNIYRSTAPREDLSAMDREGRRTRKLYPGGNPEVMWVEKGRSNIRGTDAQVAGVSDAQVAGVSDRDYLNGLVEASVAKTASQTANVAYVKTHKTGSSTMASIMYRYAKRHNLEIPQLHGRGGVADVEEFARKVEHGIAGRVDIMHYHITSAGQYLYPWSVARKNYQGIMRDPSNVNFITIMREPRSHFLSYYYFFIQPENLVRKTPVPMSRSGAVVA